MTRTLCIAALLVGFVPMGSAQAIEIVNQSNRPVVVCLHRHISEDVGGGFELIDTYWASEGWWTVKPGQSLKLPDGRNDSLCWVRLTYDSAKGTVIKPGNPAAGPSGLPVHSKAFKLRRIGPDRDDTWQVWIEQKQVADKVTATDAVNRHGCWRADGFYGYKPNTTFTVK